MIRSFIRGLTARFSKGLQTCSEKDLRNLLLLIVLILSVVGLVMIFSASSMTNIYNPENNTADPNTAIKFFRNQAIFVLFGFVCLFLIQQYLFTFIKHEIACWMLLLCLVASLIAVWKFGVVIYNAKRWIYIFGSTFQPSEFGKVVICIFFATMLARYLSNQQTRWVTLAKLGIALPIPMALIFFQPDMGTTAVVIVIIISILIAAGIKKRYLAAMMGICILAGAAGIALEPYRLTRLMTLFDPWSAAQGEGYQTIQGFIAMGSGGFFGVGLGNSVQKLNYLPIAYTDFIFAVIGEELGFVGCVGILVLFAALAVVCYEMARRAVNDFARLMIAGATAGLIFQAMLNILCVVGFFPVTGKPLPFISAGGSSLISSCMLVGLIMAGSRYNEQHAPTPQRRLSRSTLFSIVPPETELHSVTMMRRQGEQRAGRLRDRRTSASSSRSDRAVRSEYEREAVRSGNERRQKRRS